MNESNESNRMMLRENLSSAYELMWNQCAIQYGPNNLDAQMRFKRNDIMHQLAQSSQNLRIIENDDEEENERWMKHHDGRCDDRRREREDE